MLMGLFGKVKFHEKWFETFILQQKNIEGWSFLFGLISCFLIDLMVF